MGDAEGFLIKLKGIVSVTPHEYVDALLTLHDKLDSKGVKWIVNGDLAQALKVVDVQPDCIEIVCSKKDAEAIYNAVKDFSPTPFGIQTQTLPRNAVFQGQEYPVYLRSYYFDFAVKDILVKVEGDLQFKVNEWDWGDTFEFTPDYVSIVGKKTAVTPLEVLYELYASLGWADKAEKIKPILQKRLLMKRADA
jgi:hypothetical protein